MLSRLQPDKAAELLALLSPMEAVALLVGRFAAVGGRLAAVGEVVAGGEPWCP